MKCIYNLANRAHIYAIKSLSKISEVLDFVQSHSSSFRSGLDFTNLYLDNIIGFKRPKLKSETRMVNFEFDQLDRFVENSKFFDHPYEKEITAKYYVLIALTTKIMLQVGQKVNAQRDFIIEIFYEKQGKSIMQSLLDHFKNETIQTIFLHEECEQKTSVEYILNEVRKYLQKYPTFFQQNPQDQ